MILRKNETAIRTIDDWFRLAAPKGGDMQWKDGRSAKECAIAWLAKPGGLPADIAGLLVHEDFDALQIDCIEPEARLPFDAHSGPRNADVAVWAHDSRGPIAITVEAKADETFDQPVVNVLAAALEARVASASSAAIPRVADLVASLLRPKGAGEAAVSDLRYQLFTAVAGTLRMAEKHQAKRAVFVVEEFVSPQTSRAKAAANAQDLNAFVRRLSQGQVTDVTPGVLYGPFTVPGKPLFDDPAALYVGKVVHVVGEAMP